MALFQYNYKGSVSGKNPWGKLAFVGSHVVSQLGKHADYVFSTTQRP